MPQRLDADDRLNRAARRQRVAEKPFGARERRHAVAEQSFQRLGFREIVLARAGAMGVHVINRRRIQPRPAQRRLHGGERPGTFGMRCGGVMRVAARAPAGEPRDNFCPARQRRFLGLQHQHRRAFTQAHAGARGVERAAARRIHQQQRMKTAPRHA